MSGDELQSAGISSHFSGSLTEHPEQRRLFRLSLPTNFPLDQEEQVEPPESCLPFFGIMPQVVNLIETISAWNKQGVFMSMDGNFQGSMHAFTQALVSLKSLFRNTRTVNISSFSRSWCLEAIQVIAPEAPTTFDGNWTLANNFFIITPISASLASTMTESELDALTAVLMYNFGLAMQLSCLVDSQGRSKKFIKIRQLYKFAAAFAHELGSADGDLVVFWLSVSNNLAALALDVFDYDTFEASREWMGILLVTAITCIPSYNPDPIARNLATTRSVRDMPAPTA